MSRFLEELERGLSISADDIEIGCLLAERAAYLARLGRTQEARQEISDLRNKNALRPRIEISIWINIAIGIADFYDDMSSIATDRFMRAQALSRAAGLSNLQATAEAWLAHMAFGRYDFQAMCVAVSEALSLATRDLHSCLARVSLVVGESLHLAGLREVASSWYRRAQVHALSVGDETLISALMHNMTALRVAMSRYDSCRGVAVHEFSQMSVSGADSTANFDQLTGIVSLDSMTPVLRAQALSVAGFFQGALTLYSAHLDSVVARGFSRVKCWLIADRAWCELNLGLTEAARASAIEAELSISEHVQVDDLAATHDRLQQVYRLLGENEVAADHASKAGQLWKSFEIIQSNIIRGLSDADQRYNSLR